MNAKLLPVLLVSVFVAALTAAVTTSLVGPSPSRAGDPALGPEAELLRLTRSIEGLDQRQQELGRALEELRMASVSPAASRVSLGEIEAAVARYLEQADGAVGAAGERAGGAPRPVEAGREPADELTVSAAFAQLLDPDLSQSERQRIWSELGQQGLSDALVAEFEKRAELEPNDPDVRVDLGEAYLQKVFENGNGPMAGFWAMKADKAFDDALGLDSDHWNARFNKAISLSFWPPALGKQNQAIEQFEVLVQKQSTLPKDPKYAQTYLFLGNMYQQTGKPQKALEAWQQGLGLYPQNEALQQQVQLAKGG